MSLAKLFYMKEAFREGVRRRWLACVQRRSPVRRAPHVLLESLEPRVLLSATPTEAIAPEPTAALEPAAITVPAGSLPSLDVDLNGRADALSDGILIIRHLFGFTGTALTDGAVDQAGRRTDPTAIQSYLTSIHSALDVDLNQKSDALTDGILIIRSLFGFSGAALTSGAIDPAGQRTDPAAIAAFLDNLNPAREQAAPLVTAGLQQDTGLSATDAITFDPTITGAITDLNQIASFTAGFDATPVGSFVDVLADLSGTGTFTLSTARLNQLAGGTLADGAHTLHLRATDTRGNAATLDYVFTLDRVAPSAPLSDLPAEFDSGASQTDDVTNVGRPNIAISVVESGRLHLSLNDQRVDDVNLTPSGFVFVPTSPLPDGVTTVTATLEDLAGNVSPVSTPLVFRIDTAAPVFSFIDLLPLSDTPPVGDLATTQSVVMLAGMTEPLSTIQVTKGWFVATATADAQGNFSTANLVLAPGANLLSFQAIDQAGNVGAASRTITLVDDGGSVPVRALGMTSVTWDMDGNGQADAASDGALIVRYLSGLRGDALTDGVVDPAGVRGAPVIVAAYLDHIAPVVFDVDGNGSNEALRDGRLIVRYLSGFTGDELVADAVDLSGSRTTADQVLAWLNRFDVDRDPTAPVLSAQLAHDTGISNSDWRTSDAAVTGAVLAQAPIRQLYVTIDTGGNVFPDLRPDGSFSFVLSDVQEGERRYFLEAVDQRDLWSPLYMLAFEFDSIAPIIQTTNAPPGGVHGPTFHTIEMTFSEPVIPATLNASNFRLQNEQGNVIIPAAIQAGADERTLNLDFAPLAEGSYQFIVEAAMVTDLAGNAIGSGMQARDFTIAQGAEVPFALHIVDRNTPAVPFGKAVGDLNADGYLDVIVGGQAGPLVWYAGPTWIKSTIADEGAYWTDSSGAVGDIDGDGDLDVTTGQTWFENPGPARAASGPWRGHFLGEVGPHDTVIADLNQDGKMDIITRGTLAPTVALFQQVTAEEWLRKDLEPPLGTEGLAIGDLNNDGWLDVVIGGIWMENPGGNVIAQDWIQHIFTVWEDEDAAVGLTDFNGDNRLDVILSVGEGTGHLSWFANPGDAGGGDWVRHDIEQGILDSAHSMGLVDFNRDGHMDIVVAEIEGLGRLLLYKNEGQGLAWTRQQLGTPFLHNIRIGDFGQDGDLDIVGSDLTNTPPLELWENLSAPTAVPLTSVPIAGLQQDISAGDSGMGPVLSGYRVSTTASSTEVFTPSEAVTEQDGVSSVLPGDVLTGLDAVRRRERFRSLTGEGMTAVIIDTGIDVDHPFFGPDADHNGVADRIVYQWDFADNDADASDRIGHGSHIASLIGSEDLTYPGVAPEADLIALKVFSDSGTGTFAFVEQALQWVAAHAAQYGIDVVNLSLGDGQNWAAPGARYGLGDEFAALANDGIIVVAASGNNFFSAQSRPGVSYPAADPNVIGVGAVWTQDFGGPWRWSSGAIDLTTGADRITSFSQRDAAMTEIFAPGARLVGANQSGGTVTMQGTSQAAAYLSGTALLAQQMAEHDAGRKLTPQEFTELVVATGKTIVDGDDEQDNVVNTGLTLSRVDMLQLAKGVHRFAAWERGERGHHHREHGFALAYAQRCWVKEFVSEGATTADDGREELLIALPG